ncbi:hypothetical protein CR513_49971, partial [Mucuna pruriens]
MRNLLEEFHSDHGLSPPTILGVIEHVFTERVRMHYGHPDVFDRIFHITRGGISKASRLPMLLASNLPRKELQLVGLSSMLLASKYEEIRAPKVNDFVCISDNAYVSEQVLMMEKTILRKLEWYLTVSTPYVFLV